MDLSEITAWLQEQDPEDLEELWHKADEVRREHVGDAVFLRGLMEVSNHCIRKCAYCGISACAPAVARYRMSEAEMADCAREARRLGFGTVVIQAGEDPLLGRDLLVRVIRTIKDQTGLAITLSLGERGEDELRAWREAGADRYLLRFETSDPELYRAIHPSLPGSVSDRLVLIRRLRELGYEVGSGVMVGLPGQTWEILGRDLLTFRDLDLDMIGVGPYIPSPGTPLEGGLGRELRARAGDRQVPTDEPTTLKVIALARLLCPDANIPSTTALATLDREHGRELALCRGANVVMPNVTPPKYRVLYQIYPGKACLFETGAVCRGCLEGRIRGVGRFIGSGSGSRREDRRGALPCLG